MRSIAVIQRFLPSRSRGGVGHFTHGLCQTLAHRGHRVTVFSQDPAPAGAVYAVHQVQATNAGLAKKFASLSFPFALARQDFSGFDVIHAQGDNQFISRHRPPLVRTMHGTALAEAWFNGVLGKSPKRFALHMFFYAMECLADLRADRVVTVSAETQHFYPRAHAVIPNGVDLAAFAPGGVPKSTAPSVIFVGEVASRTRGQTSIDVMARAVVPRVPGEELWLVSPDGVDRPWIRTFRGIDDAALADLMKRAWVMCLPSAYEGFGRPYIEAMAAGTAVLASPNPGAREVLRDGRDGVIAPDADLGDALVRLLTDRREREEMAERGLARVQVFGWDVVAGQYEQVYEDRDRGGAAVHNILLHTTSVTGGSDVSLVRLVEQLDRSLFRSTVVLPSDGPLVSRLHDAGARVIVVPELLKLTSRRGRGFLVWFALNYPRAIWRLVQIIKRERIAIVHTNTIHNLYGFAAARLAGVPHVWHIREIVWQSGLLRRLELGCARRWSARIVVTSDAVAAMFGERSAWPPQLVKVPNGIEIDRFSRGDGGRVRNLLGVRSDQFLAGIVCRLDIWKGVEVFLEAAAIVANTHPDARFVVVGGPIIGLEAYAETLPALAARLGLADRVHFTRWQFGPADMPDVQRALDVLVLASTEAEPFGLVLLEAMAASKPVIATKQGGPLEIVVDGETGVLVPPSDPPALADAIAKMSDDSSAAKAMGEAGRRRVAEHYTAERYVASIEAIYRQLIAA